MTKVNLYQHLKILKIFYVSYDLHLKDLIYQKDSIKLYYIKTNYKYKSNHLSLQFHQY